MTDQRWNDRFDRLTTIVEGLASVAHDHSVTTTEMQTTIKELTDAQRITQASLDSLIAGIDRFIRGQQSNGH